MIFNLQRPPFPNIFVRKNLAQMAVNGPIVLIEDDNDEQSKVEKALTEIGIKNALEVFLNAEDALSYLETTAQKPFIILSKMSLPGMSGLDFLDKIYGNEYLRKKSIPFVFFANVAPDDEVQAAFDRRVQGYFLKPKTMIVLKLTLMSITDYWLRSTHPHVS